MLFPLLKTNSKKSELVFPYNLSLARLMPRHFQQPLKISQDSPTTEAASACRALWAYGPGWGLAGHQDGDGVDVGQGQQGEGVLASAGGDA